MGSLFSPVKMAQPSRAGRVRQSPSTRATFRAFEAATLAAMSANDPIEHWQLEELARRALRIAAEILAARWSPR